jgi:type II secretory pathway component PulJ
MNSRSCLAQSERSPTNGLGGDGVEEGLKRVRLQWRNARPEPVKRRRHLVRSDYRSGYLLLEVLLALAVLSISVVMIFKIIQTTLKVTADINFLQTQQRKVDGIFELLRRNFDSMPLTCTFQTRNVNNSLELIFRSAPFNFSWVTAGANFGTVVIASRRQADGRFALSVLQESGNALDSYVENGNERKADWFPVMNDADRISWRFFDATSGKWTPDWPDVATKPNLVELTFKLAGLDHIERCVFRWPIVPTGS